MDASAMIRDLFETHKKIFQESVNALRVFQDQAGKWMWVFWDKSAFLPEENKKWIERWFEHCKTSLNNFQEHADERFQFFEDCFSKTADQLESSLRGVVEKKGPVQQMREKMKKQATGMTKGDSPKKTRKKDKVTLDELKK